MPLRVVATGRSDRKCPEKRPTSCGFGNPCIPRLSAGVMDESDLRGHWVERRYARRFKRRVVSDHAIRKLVRLDMTYGELAEVLVGRGVVIHEQVLPNLQPKEIVLLVEWTRPLHVVLVIDVLEQEETCDRVRARSPRVDGRPEETAMTTCENCGSGGRRRVRAPQVADREGRVALVLDVPAEECTACGTIWLDEQTAQKLTRHVPGDAGQPG